MASTTTNLGLTKPAYSDDADISDINGNMDLIDAEAGKVRANVAANYDSSETYAVGDYCLHDGSLYKCSTAISSPEAWTAGHWTQIKIAGELSTLNGKIGNLLFTKEYTVTPTDNSVVAYATSDMMTKYAQKDISSDIATYGTVIAVYATGYGGIPVPANVDNGTLQAPQWRAYSDDVVFTVTFKK